MEPHDETLVRSARSPCRHDRGCRHLGGDAWSGKRAVVIGANNSAHDICAALVENGAEVTMVQRSSTHIVRSDSLMELVFGGLYSEDALETGLTTDKADMLFASIPYKVMPGFHQPIFAAIKERDKDFYERLAKAGFRLPPPKDPSHLCAKKQKWLEKQFKN